MTKGVSIDIPDESGRRIVVTGANTGLGKETAAALAAAGASIVLACRNVEKGKAAAAGMSGDVEVRRLDLSDLASVRSFADSVGGVDVLINNAGVMAIPERRTADGFEMQFGTNHLGHFALTGLLLPRLTDRVVTVASNAHRLGRIRLDDLNWENRRYSRSRAYGQSKLANLMFTYELQRRLHAAGSPLRALAAHPGYAATELQTRTESFMDRISVITNRFAPSARAGALPTIYAATWAEAPGGEYFGPGSRRKHEDHPVRDTSSKRSHDQAIARQLFAASEKLTGVTIALRRGAA